MVSFRPLCSHKYDWLFCGGIYVGILNYFDILLWFVPASMSAWPGSFSSPPQVDWWSWVLTCPRERRSRWSAASQVKRFFFAAPGLEISLAEVGACRIWHSAKSGTHHRLQCFFLETNRAGLFLHHILELDEGNIYRKPSSGRVWKWGTIATSMENMSINHWILTFQSHGYFFSNQSINYRTRQWIGRRLQGRSWPSVKKSSLFNEQLPTPCDGWFQTTFSKSLGL